MNGMKVMLVMLIFCNDKSNDSASSVTLGIHFVVLICLQFKKGEKMPRTVFSCTYCRNGEDYRTEGRLKFHRGSCMSNPNREDVLRRRRLYNMRSRNKFKAKMILYSQISKYEAEKCRKIHPEDAENGSEWELKPQHSVVGINAINPTTGDCWKLIDWNYSWIKGKITDKNVIEFLGSHRVHSNGKAERIEKISTNFS